MDVTVSERGPVSVVSLRGTLAIGAADETFRQKIRELLDGGHVRIVLDCSELRTMDSTGLNSFLFALTESGKKGGAVTLLSPNERVLSVFKTTQLDDVFQVHGKLDDAVASIQPPS